MRGAIPPLPSMPSWRGGYLSTVKTLPFVSKNPLEAFKLNFVDCDCQKKYSVSLIISTEGKMLCLAVLTSLKKLFLQAKTAEFI
jgi:hypothetical protein